MRSCWLGLGLGLGLGLVNSALSIIHTAAEEKSPPPFRKSNVCAAFLQNNEASYNFWVNSYINGRYELSKADDSIQWNNNIYSPRMKRKVETFFKANVSSCIHMVNDRRGRRRPVWYVTIFKAGNNNIRGNLQHFSGTPPEDISVKGYCPLWTPQQAEQRLRAERWTASSTPSFSFVREPLGHFMSGLAEAYYRSLHEKYNIRRYRNRGWEPPDELSTVDMVKSLIRDQLRGGRVQIFEREHYYPMAGVLHLWPDVSFIGRLEHFDRDWRRVNTLYDTAMTTYDKAVGAHMSSNDPNLIKKHTLQLLEEYPAYKRALCHLLLVDFVCFEYALPEECANISPPYSLHCDRKNMTLLRAAVGGSRGEPRCQ